MAPDRATLAIGFLTVFLLRPLPTVAEQPTQLTIEKEFQQRGDYMSVGFSSLWMMSGMNLMRIGQSDNSSTEIPIKGATGRWRRIAVAEGAVWVADNISQTIYEIDPATNQVVRTIPADYFPTTKKQARSQWARVQSGR